MGFADMGRNQIEEQAICPHACRELWCAVIEEQLRLVVSPKLSDRRVEIFGARHWFGSRDFFMTCSLAGVDGHWVLGGVRRHLARLEGAA